MSTHTVHPNSHEHGLADDCGRCDEHAARPFMTLDGSNLRSLFDRVLLDAEPRSNNERIAMDQVDDVLQKAGHLMRVNPSGFVGYMNRIWGIRMILVEPDGDSHA